MIEDAVEASGDLVDSVRRKDVLLRNYGITAMVGNALVGAESVLRSPRGRTSRDEVCCLIVAEAGKDGIVAGQIVIHANVTRAFVEPADWLVGVVVTDAGRNTGSGGGIELRNGKSDGVDQGAGNDGARRTNSRRDRSLTSCIGTRECRSDGETSADTTDERGKALNAGRWVNEVGVWIGETGNAKRIRTLVVIPIGVGSNHLRRRNVTGERDAFALHLGLIVEEEESLVFPDGAAERAAELVQIKFPYGVNERSRCIEVSIAEELKRRPMELV